MFGTVGPQLGQAVTAQSFQALPEQLYPVL